MHASQLAPHRSRYHIRSNHMEFYTNAIDWEVNQTLHPGWVPLSATAIDCHCTLQPSSIYPHIRMSVPRSICVYPQATVENACTDTAISLAIDFYYANRNTITTVLSPRKDRSPSRISISIRRVRAMHKIPFSHLEQQLLLAEICKHVPKHTRRKWCLQLLKKRFWRNGDSRCNVIDGDLLFG